MTDKGILNNGIQVEGGWSIDANVFIDKNYNILDIPFDNTLLLSAVNHITGKTISISYENSNVGYSFDTCVLSRSLGEWRNDDATNIYKTIKTGHHIDEFYDLLSEYLNPLQKDLIPLKISSWTIIYNNLKRNNDGYDDRELIFSATRGKLFIDITYNRNWEKPYYIYMGLSKYDYSEIVYNLNKPPREYQEIFLENVEEVVVIINDFLIELDHYLSGIPRKS
ncbi:hypothetical protein WH221_01440 [Chryseobacterium culicis]|uniref:Uncharacterized protein n=1 Tax=Chryseobacterium culicis TaxID=680127 RepID=A0A2S9CWQ5_CHRCI|nr:hypothetical protein [Chryseobacterium culicis]PRB84949.1 hypothetical protein CQ022_01385 [Chryseobacterium culicis]PRB91327.1 hypothetical protein CQ033_11605 [Chryseobacterium culicis]